MGLELVELVMEIEDRFDVSIPDERASRMSTVGDTRDEVVRLLIAGGTPQAHDLPDEVMAGIVEIVSKQMAMKPAQIEADSRWVGDIT